MSTPNPNRCPRCGAPKRADSRQDSCPACLLAAALTGPEDETLASTAHPLATPERTESLPREFGGYGLLRLLGTGGMGTVYEAEERATGRRVALKVLAQRIDTPQMRRRFLREGRLAASVNHPNSLYVFGSEEIDDAPVITMEVADAGTLNDQLVRRGPLAVKDAVDAILDVVGGLEAAHAGGVLHRDVKPSNCFVSHDGSVKVGDFGISVSTHARDDSYVTSGGVIIGTPAYAAPEQLRGDSVDLRADIYSVGATLFTLVTGRPPFEGDNAVQVVANASNQAPPALSSLCKGVPPGLDRVGARCLAKEAEDRFQSYAALRDALLPFGSLRPEPASPSLRASAGWIDYLIAFLVPYVVSVFSVGKEELLIAPLVERSPASFGYYLVAMAFGLVYFTIAEGVWGAGLGKRLRGLQVVRAKGRPPGPLRALMRILIPVALCEVVRIPLLLATISAPTIDALTGFEIVMIFVAFSLCPWIPTVSFMVARRGSGFATLWDRATGTRVIVRPKGVVRARIEPAPLTGRPAEEGQWLGPYKAEREIVPGEWIVASDPVLRRRVWLQRRSSEGPTRARRSIARPGRVRWLQGVESAEATWDAYEASAGAPLASLAAAGEPLPWGTLRLWLHDLATELWSARRDGTLPVELGLDHVWITSSGRPLLLDAPWPIVEERAERFAVQDLAGQQRFLAAVAALVDVSSLPLHARPLVENLQEGKIEKLSFVTGTLRGLLDKPTQVGRGVRAGSIFMLPIYIWTMLFAGSYQGADWLYSIVGNEAPRIAAAMGLLVLTGSAVLNLLGIFFRSTFGQSLFRLAVVDGSGRPASRYRLLLRWALVWLPFLLLLAAGAWIVESSPEIAVPAALILIVAMLGAGLHTAWHPRGGWHDRLAGTWVVRR